VLPLKIAPSTQSRCFIPMQHRLLRAMGDALARRVSPTLERGCQQGDHRERSLWCERHGRAQNDEKFLMGLCKRCVHNQSRPVVIRATHVHVMLCRRKTASARLFRTFWAGAFRQTMRCTILIAASLSYSDHSIMNIEAGSFLPVSRPAADPSEVMPSAG
jgi:hypothetical protein